MVCNKRTIESLVKAGAFDSLGHAPAPGWSRSTSVYVDSLVDEKRHEAVGQDSLFGGLDDDAGRSSSPCCRPSRPASGTRSTLLAFERDMLGLYVSDHPLLGVEHVLARLVDAPIARVMADEARPDGSNLSVAGLITGLQFKTTKQGKPWAIATLEDLEGAIEVLFFPQTFEQVRNLLRQDLICVVRGRLNRRDDVPTLYAMELTIPDVTEAPARPGGHLAAADPADPAGGRAAQGRAGRPPRRHRGARAARAAGQAHRAAPGRRAAGDRRARPCSATSSTCSARAAWSPEPRFVTVRR